MIEGLIFDFDHTISENSETNDSQILAILRQFSVPGDDAAILDIIQAATSDYAICKHFLLGEAIDKAYQMILAVNLDQVGKARYSDAVIHVLIQLNLRYPLFVLSGRDELSLKHSLQQKKIGHLFKEIVGDNLMALPKPHPDNLVSMANRNALDLNNCIYIGDSLTDHQLALSAGCHFIGAGWYHQQLTNIQPCCDDVRNLSDLIDKVPETIS